MNSKVNRTRARTTNELGSVFSNLESSSGKPIHGEKGVRLEPLADRILPADLKKQLKNLPRAARVKKDWGIVGD